MKRIQTLDGLRGIAVLMVVAGHIGANYQPLGPEVRRWFVAFANPGAGVRLFFVLSGYLITYLLLEEHARTGTVSLSQFYRRRASRIFPAFYTYLTVLIVLSFWRPMGINWSTGIAAGTFTWNYSAWWVTAPPEGTWNLGHLWTLALEQQFYLFWPAVLCAFRVRGAIVMAVALILWCPFARVASYFLFPATRGQIGMMFHTAIDSLMIGCATALVARNTKGQRLLTNSGAILATVATMWLLVASPLVSEIIRGFPAVAGYTLDAVAAGMIVSWLHHHAPEWAYGLLGRGILPALGLISYSLYLWQQPFLRPDGPLHEGRAILPCLAAVSAATVSYFVIERPALRLKSRFKPVRAPMKA